MEDLNLVVEQKSFYDYFVRMLFPCQAPMLFRRSDDCFLQHYNCIQIQWSLVVRLTFKMKCKINSTSYTLPPVHLPTIVPNIDDLIGGSTLKSLTSLPLCCIGRSHAINSSFSLQRLNALLSMWQMAHSQVVTSKIGLLLT